MGMPHWTTTPIKGFEKLTIPCQPIAIPIKKGDPHTLYLLNIGTVKHARTQFVCSAIKNLYAIPVDILIRIAKAVTLYNILFADAKTPLSQRAISWLTDVGRILIFPFSWVIVIIAELYAAAHLSSCTRNAVIKLENTLFENNKLDYLKPMTRAEVDSWARTQQIANPAPRSEAPEAPIEAGSSSSTAPSIQACEPTPVIPLTAEEQHILDTFTPQMVEALGGVKKVLSFPVLENWNGVLDPKYLTAPVMRSVTSEGVCLLFCYWRLEKDKYKVRCEALARRGKGWEGAYDYPSSEINLSAPGSIADGSLGEKYMLDKISRLVQGKAVGAVEQFCNVSWVISDPKDNILSRPKKAYLKGDDLLKYMEVPTLFYEKEPQAGTTEIFLYDRSKQKENQHQLFARFPAMAPK